MRLLSAIGSIAMLTTLVGCLGEADPSAGAMATSPMDQNGDGLVEAVDLNGDGLPDMRLARPCADPMGDDDDNGIPDYIDIDCDGLNGAADVDLDCILNVVDQLEGLGNDLGELELLLEDLGICLGIDLGNLGGLPDLGGGLPDLGGGLPDLGGGLPGLGGHCIPALQDDDGDGIPDSLDLSC